MGKLIDRILIFLFSVFAMSELLTGRYLIVVVYITLIITFLSFALISQLRPKSTWRPEGVREIIAWGLQFLSVLLVFWQDRLIVILPVIIYDAVFLKNYFGIVMIFFAAYSAIRSGMDIKAAVYLTFLMLISGYLSRRTQKAEETARSYLKLRDEFVISEEQLKEKNLSLLQAKDREIETAQLKERNRIAREIHDNVGHMLTRAILQTGALLTVYREEPLNAQLEGLKETLDTAMDNIRTSVHDLHDEAIDVEAALEQIAEPLQARFQLRLEVDISRQMPVDVKYALIGAAKEAVSNILKHSKNDHVDIICNEHPSMYQLVIHDYCRKKTGELEREKIDPLRGLVYARNHSRKYEKTSGQDSGKGIGLDNIRTRVENVGGRMHVSGEQGFRIFIIIPKAAVET